MAKVLAHGDSATPEDSASDIDSGPRLLPASGETASSILARDEETTGRAVPKLLAAELGVGVAFAVAGTPYAHVFASVTHPYQGHDMTSCCWLVVMDSERFASPIEGIFCGGLNAYCMHIRPLFLRTSGSSGVLKALLLERNGQLSCNPKKKKKKKKKKPRLKTAAYVPDLGCSPAVGRLFAGARLSWWLGRDVVESQLLGRGVRRGNSTRNHALSGCARLIRLLSRCLLSATTRDDFAASQGPT